MSYPGGKSGSGVYQTLINLMPPHDVYIEPFLGGGAIMRLKRPAILNVGVDLDPAVGPALGLSREWKTLQTFATTKNGDGRRPRFTFECANAIHFLKSWTFSGSELVYCDPPYLRSTRATRPDLYKFEMTDAQHRELLAVLKGLKCRVMISGYSSTLYARELKGWHATAFQAATRGKPAAEWVWCNYPRPVELHDYRYLGSNFREREYIKRMQKRWVAKLEAMPALKRQGLLAAIASIAGTAGGGSAA